MDEDPPEAGPQNSLLRMCIGDMAVPDAKVLEVVRAEGGNAMLRNAVLSLYLDRLAMDRGIGVTDEELQAAADEFRARRALEKRADMMAWLAGEGLDADGFADMLERNLRRDKLREAVVSKAEVERRFLSYRFAQQMICLSCIHVASLGRAEEIRDQIIEGELAFPVAALRYSEEEDAQRNSGFLGWRCRAEIDATIAGVLFSAAPGDVLGPFEQGGRFQIFKVWEIQGVTLSEEIYRTLRDEIFAEWCDEESNKAGIAIRA